MKRCPLKEFLNPLWPTSFSISTPKSSNNVNYSSSSYLSSADAACCRQPCLYFWFLPLLTYKAESLLDYIILHSASSLFAVHTDQHPPHLLTLTKIAKTTIFRAIPFCLALTSKVLQDVIKRYQNQLLLKPTQFLLSGKIPGKRTPKRASTKKPSGNTCALGNS